MVVPDYLAHAQSMVGTREGQSALTDYLHTGGQNLDPVTRAWCGAFINATLQASGYGGTGSDLAKSFLNYGTGVDVKSVQPGDIAVFNRGDPRSIYGHAGLVKAYDPATGRVQLVSGNVGNSVAEQWMDANTAIGFRRPVKSGDASAGTPAAGAPAAGAPATSYSPEQRRNAIANIESSGSGDYGALGPISPGGGHDRAYGRYQMMGKNIPGWTQQVLGRSMTPDEFVKDPKAQDAVFDKIFGGYVQQHGERGAASMWFTGRPDEPNVTDVNGKLTGKSYADRYVNGLGTQPAAAPGTANVAANTPAAGAGGATPADAAKKDTSPPGIDQLATGLEQLAGGGSSVPNVSMPRMARPLTAMTSPVQGVGYAGGASAEGRNALAMAMARLNSGKLWG
jgi:uncharacterized protein (TIGR02594 family)